MSLRSARARTARPAATPVKSARKVAKAAAPARATRSSAAPRPMSTPPAGRPKVSAVAVPKAPAPPSVLPTVVRPPVPSAMPTKLQFKLGDKVFHRARFAGFDAASAAAACSELKRLKVDCLVMKAE